MCSIWLFQHYHWTSPVLSIKSMTKTIKVRPEFHLTNLKETTPLEGTTLYKETRYDAGYSIKVNWSRGDGNQNRAGFAQSKTVQFDLSRSKVYRLSGPVSVHYWRAHWARCFINRKWKLSRLAYWTIYIIIYVISGFIFVDRIEHIGCEPEVN